MKKAEKLPRAGHGPFGASATPGDRRWYKRLVIRMRRAAERRDPENVPQRFTRGWYW